MREVSDSPRSGRHPTRRRVSASVLGVLLAVFAIYQFSPAAAQTEGGATADRSATTAPPSPRVPADVPSRGMVYAGLRPPINGECGNPKLFVIEAGSDCTHGPDPAPIGVDLNKSPAPVSAGETAAAATTCDGDGFTGMRTQVAYVRASDVPDRYATYLASFRQWAAAADAIYLNSALETGGVRRVRFVQDAACNIVVANIVVSPTGDDDFANTRNDLRAAGYDRTDRKYMLFVDSNVYCGIGSVRSDDSPGPTNQNNTGPRYGRTDRGCWGGPVAAHEHMHNLGGVQLSAPHTSGGYHCVDEYDRMCYSDTPNHPAMQFLCADTAHDRRFDCNHDDYYNTSPAPGSYLATHWNTANNQALILGPSYTVSGTVRDAGGGALSGAKVQLLNGTSGLASTNGSGAYAISGVVDGTYQVRAQWGCYGPVTQNVVVNGNETVDFSLPKRVDGAGFSCRPTTYSYVNATTVLSLTGDNGSTSVALPFAFRFQGQNRTTAYINTNGVVNFSAADSSFNNTAIPNGALPNAAIYGFWDDLNLDGSSSVRTSVVGSTPNRRFVIEWRDVTAVGLPGSRFSFEVILQEDGDPNSNDVISLQYKDIDPGTGETGTGATVGIENNNGSSGLQYFTSDGILRSGDAVRISPK